MTANINVDAHHFLADLSPWGYRNRFFPGYIVPSDSKETERRRIDQEVFQSSVKTLG